VISAWGELVDLGDGSVFDFRGDLGGKCQVEEKKGEEGSHGGEFGS
jgi:hypothetical protein